MTFPFPAAFILRAPVSTLTGTYAGSKSSNRVLDTGASSRHGGIRFTATGTGTVRSAKWSIASSGTGNWHCELWSNSGSSPGAKIGSSSATVAVTASGEQTFTWATEPAITSGSSYWVILYNETPSSTNWHSTGNSASYISGRNATITSITNDLDTAFTEDWWVQIEQMI